MTFWAQYKVGILKIDEYLTFALSFIAGKSWKRWHHCMRVTSRTAVKPMVRQPALDLVKRHEGDLTCIVTATNEF